MESSAHQTLRLRAFYRLLKRMGKASLDSYYKFCNGESKVPYDESNKHVWDDAGVEAQQLELGKAEHNRLLDNRISSSEISPHTPWVLIGGPPCQAYSLVGRSRNRGKKEYRAEEDHRHFLYKEYLRIIQKYRPSVFVMENVKGILSASVGGTLIFQTILNDLSDPDSALGEPISAPGYRIYSLSCPTSFSKNSAGDPIDVHDFIIRAEDYGVPQARHRVILLGVREDITTVPKTLEPKAGTTVLDAISDLPRLRSKLSKQPDGGQLWVNAVQAHMRELANEMLPHQSFEATSAVLERAATEVNSTLSVGSSRLTKIAPIRSTGSSLDTWYEDTRLSVWLGHEARGHITGDLRRYAYAAAFAEAHERSPKGHSEFQFSGLRPNHDNWETGKFSDRFRVQLSRRPATTVTSHISKDGHYFIHPDPSQCRSLTVREAARLQTFPDNYFFQGNRTQQFHQVGNAVPPLLAAQIGELVYSLLVGA